MILLQKLEHLVDFSKVSGGTWKSGVTNSLISTILLVMSVYGMVWRGPLSNHLFQSEPRVSSQNLESSSVYGRNI